MCNVMKFQQVTVLFVAVFFYSLKLHIDLDIGFGISFKSSLQETV